MVGYVQSAASQKALLYIGCICWRELWLLQVALGITQNLEENQNVGCWLKSVAILSNVARTPRQLVNKSVIASVY